MAEIIIRPTMKFIIAGYIAVLVVIAVVTGFTIHLDWPNWVPAVAALLFIWPLERHLHRQSERISILEDRLRYDVGILSKSTRTILISRVQDVTVRQRLAQRIFGVGDLSIETAGEASGLTIESIDHPHQTADHITGLSQKGIVQGQGL